jgi:hypothetical protein
MEQLFGCRNRKTNKEWKINVEEKFTPMKGGVGTKQETKQKAAITRSAGQWRQHPIPCTMVN